MGVKLFAPEKKKINLENKNISEDGKIISRKEKKAKAKRIYSAQKTVPVYQIHEDGLFESKKGYFNKSILFEDISYQTARPDDQISMFTKYCNLLNFFSSDVKLQITINNKSRNKKQFDEATLLKAKSDGKDNLRKEYNMAIKTSGSKESSVEKEKYFTITIPAKDADEAKKKLHRLESEINTSMKDLGSSTKTLDTKERLEILHDFFRPGEEGKFIYRRENKFTQTSYKDLIAPDSFEFEKDYFLLGEKFARVLYFRELPSFMLDKIIAELTDFDINMMLSIHIEPIEQEAAIRMVQKQIRGMETDKIKYQKRSTKDGYFDAFIPMELTFSLDEAKELLDSLMNKNERMFLVNVTIMHSADSKEQLDEDSKNIAGSASLIQMGKLNLQQEDAMATALPLGNKKIQVDRVLTTSSTGVLIPFTSQELNDINGVYYGVNSVSKNLLLFNRKKLQNASGFIFGTSGSGKSFSAKRELIDVYLRTDDDIIYIDPERECASLALKLGGELVHISNSSKNYINPFDINLNYSDKDDPVTMKSDFIESLFDLILGGKKGLDPIQLSIIDDCIDEIYEPYLKSLDPNDMPTFAEFYEALKKQDHPQANDLALALRRYTKGKLSVFSNRTNIDIDNRLIVFDTKDLGTQLKTMGLLIVLDQVWNRITKNRSKGKNTWIYIDEIYLLFNNDYSANFLYELYKRARKWGGIPTGITQDVNDLLSSKNARSMLANSQFVMMLNQEYENREELSKLFSLSETQSNFITNSKIGNGLMRCGAAIVPFEDKFPENTDLYKIMTTKLDEIDTSML